MARFKGTLAEKELQRLFDSGAVSTTTKPKDVQGLSELFKSFSESAFKAAFYRFSKERRMAGELARNGGRTTPTSFLAAGTDGNNAGASVLGMEVPAAVSTGGTVAGSVLGAGTAAAPVELDDVPSVARAAARRLTYEDSDLTFQPPAITDCVKHNNQLVQYAVIVLPSGTNVLGGLKYFVNPEDLSELVVAVQMPPLMGNARAIHGDMLKDMNPQEQNNHIRVSNYLDVLQGMRPSSGGWPWFHATIKLPLECLTGTFTRNQLYQQADGTKVLCLDMLVEDGTTAKKLGVKNVEDDFEDEPHAVFDA